MKEMESALPIGHFGDEIGGDQGTKETRGDDGTELYTIRNILLGIG